METSSSSTSNVPNTAGDYDYNPVNLGKWIKWSCLLHESLFNDVVDKASNKFIIRELDEKKNV